jgi:hypothetical protein
MVSQRRGITKYEERIKKKATAMGCVLILTLGNL